MTTNVNKKKADNKVTNGVKQGANGSKTSSLMVVTPSGQDVELIDEIERSINEATVNVDHQISNKEEEIALLSGKKDEIGAIKKLLYYWKDAQKMLNIIKGDNIKCEVKVTIADAEDTVSLQSNKIETVKSVITLLSDSSKARMEELIKLKD